MSKSVEFEYSKPFQEEWVKAVLPLMKITIYKRDPNEPAITATPSPGSSK